MAENLRIEVFNEPDDDSAESLRRWLLDYQINGTALVSPLGASVMSNPVPELIVNLSASALPVLARALMAWLRLRRDPNATIIVSNGDTRVELRGHESTVPVDALMSALVAGSTVGSGTTTRRSRSSPDRPSLEPSRPNFGSVPSPPEISGYRFVSYIAAGGDAIVYQYRQLNPHRSVAVKVLTNFAATSAQERIEAEAAKMAMLGTHPNVVPVLAIGVTSRGHEYIVMPFYPGGSLADLVVMAGPLALRRVVRIGVLIAGALDASHRIGLLHCDVKPANILIDEYGNVRLTDFGIAQWIKTDDENDVALSLPWSPPEVVAGANNTPASDIYSLGATLYHLLVGHPPHFSHDNTRAALERRIQGAEVGQTGRADVPDTLEDLLARMLARNPEWRPESASHVERELLRIERSLGGPIPADSPWRLDDTSIGVPSEAATSPRTMARILTPVSGHVTTAARGNSWGLQFGSTTPHASVRDDRAVSSHVFVRRVLLLAAWVRRWCAPLSASSSASQLRMEAAYRQLETIVSDIYTQMGPPPGWQSTQTVGGDAS